MLSIIIQARMNSRRMPGKVLKNVFDKPLLSYLLERVLKVKEVEQVIIATSNEKKDDAIEKFCEYNKILFYRGSENNLLERFFFTAKKYNCNPIIRLTGDCPLMDPLVISDQIKFFFNNKLDYGYLGPSFPEGICSDIFKYDTLEKTYKNATLSSDLEHITPYMHKNKDIFKVKELKDYNDNSKFRFTVDHPNDFYVVRKIIEHFIEKGNIHFSYKEIITYLRKNKKLFNKNKDIIRNEKFDPFSINTK